MENIFLFCQTYRLESFMKKNTKYRIMAAIWLLLVISAFAVLFIVPVSGKYLHSISNELAMIIILLTIPYCILKIVFHFSRNKNKPEKEFRIEDMPKDADEFKNKK